VKQISVISKNRPGVVAEISQTLARESINIDSLVSEAIEDNAITILTVDHYDKALRALQNLAGMRVVTEDVILVKLEDRPGALAELALRFKNAGISLNSLRIIERGEQQSLVAISTERTGEALDLVKEMLIS